MDVIRCQLEPEAKEQLGEFCERTGSTQISTMSRLVMWFVNQPPEIQAYIQGHLARDIEEDISAFIFKKLNKSRE